MGPGNTDAHGAVLDHSAARLGRMGTYGTPAIAKLGANSTAAAELGAAAATSTELGSSSAANSDGKSVLGDAPAAACVGGATCANRDAGASGSVATANGRPNLRAVRPRP